MDIQKRRRLVIDDQQQQHLVSSRAALLNLCRRALCTDRMSLEVMSRTHVLSCPQTIPLRRSITSLVHRTPGLHRLPVSRLQQAKQSRTRSCRSALQVSAALAEPSVPPVKSSDGFEVSEETLSGSRKRITITAPPKTCKKAWQRMIKQARKEVKAPGFRDMKSVTEATLLPYLGGELGAKGAAVEEVVKNLPAEVAAYTKDAISESIMPVGLTDEKVGAFDVTKPFTYQIEFDLPPKLTWRRPYKGLKVEVAAAGDDKSAAARVEQELLQVRRKKGGLKVVQGRGLKVGDAALVDFDAKQTDTGEVFQGAKRRKTHMDTDSADMQFLPGVSQAMEGMKVGETREVQLTLPDDFEPAALRGVPITCQVGISELFEYELAELDDDLANEVAPGAGGAEGLRTQLLKMQREKTAQDTEEAVNEALMAAVVDSAEAEIPQHFIADMGRQEYQALLLGAVARKELQYEQALQLATQESVENYTLKNKDKLKQLVLRSMAFETIFAKENLGYSEEEFQQEYEDAKHEFEESGSDFDDARLREQVAENLKGPKIVNWLREHSEITLLPSRA